jgi:hypothetical protein
MTPTEAPQLTPDQLRLLMAHVMRETRAVAERWGPVAVMFQADRWRKAWAEKDQPVEVRR